MRIRQKYWRFKWKIRNIRFRAKQKFKRGRKGLKTMGLLSRFVRFFMLCKVFVNDWHDLWRGMCISWLVSSPAYQGSRFDKFFEIVKRVVGVENPSGDIAWAWELTHPRYMVCLMFMGTLTKAGPFIAAAGGSRPSGIDMGPNMKEMFTHTMEREESNDEILALLRSLDEHNR